MDYKRNSEQNNLTVAAIDAPMDLKDKRLSGWAHGQDSIYQRDDDIIPQLVYDIRSQLEPVQNDQDDFEMAQHSHHVDIKNRQVTMDCQQRSRNQDELKDYHTPCLRTAGMGDDTDTDRAEPMFNSQSLNQWTRNASKDRRSGSLPRSGGRTSEDLTVTPPKIIDGKSIYSVQRQKQYQFVAKHVEVRHNKHSTQQKLQKVDVFNIKEMFSDREIEALHNWKRSPRPIFNPQALGSEKNLQKKPLGPSPLVVSDMQISKKALLADAITNTNIRFKVQRSKKSQNIASAHPRGKYQNQSHTTQETQIGSNRESPVQGSESMAAVRSVYTNNATPFEVGKNDLKAFARYGVLNHNDMAKSMPTFVDKSKSKNAALYERTRYLELQRINDQMRALELARHGLSNQDFKREQFARSQLADAKDSYTNHSQIIKQPNQQSFRGSAETTEDKVAIQGAQQASHHSRANSTFNLTFQSSRIRDGNFIRWPQGLTNQGVLNDQKKFKQFNQTQSNFLNCQPKPLPQVHVHNQRRGTRFAVSSLQNSLDDYRSQGGLFLPKIVADLPSERAQQAHDSSRGSIDSGKHKTAGQQRPIQSLREQSANSNQIGGGQLNYSSASSDLDNEVGQVALVHQGGSVQFLKKSPFISNPTLFKNDTQRTRVQRGLKMSQANLSRSPKQKTSEIARSQPPSIHEKKQPSVDKQKKRATLEKIEQLRKKANTDLANVVPAPADRVPVILQINQTDKNKMNESIMVKANNLSQAKTSRNQVHFKSPSCEKLKQKQSGSKSGQGKAAKKTPARGKSDEISPSKDANTSIKPRSKERIKSKEKLSDSRKSLIDAEGSIKLSFADQSQIHNLKTIRKKRDEVKMSQKASKERDGGPGTSTTGKKADSKAMIRAQEQKKSLQNLQLQFNSSPRRPIRAKDAGGGVSRFRQVVQNENDTESNNSAEGAKQRLSDLVKQPDANLETGPLDPQLDPKTSPSKAPRIRLAQSVATCNLEQKMALDRAHLVDPYGQIYKQKARLPPSYAFTTHDDIIDKVEVNKQRDNLPKASLKQVKMSYAVGIQHELLLSRTKCKRLVPNNKQRENESVILQVGRQQEFFVYSADQVPTFVRLQVRDQNSPARVKISYLERSEAQAQKQDLQVYCSSRIQRPGPGQCDRKYVDKQELVQIYAYNEDGERLRIFEQDYAYVGLYSQSGCRIMLTYAHPTANTQGRQMSLDPSLGQTDEFGVAKNGGAGASLRSKIFQMLLQLYIENSGAGDVNISSKKVMALLQDEQLMQDLIPREDSYYQQMLKQQREAAQRLRRAMISSSQPEVAGDLMTGHLFNHPLLQFHNAKRAMNKKEEMDLFDHKFKLFKMHRWQILKDIKQQLIQYFQDVYRQRMKVKLFISYIVLDRLLRGLARVFRVRVDIACREAHARYISFRIAYLFAQSRKRTGLKLEKRNHLKMNMLLTASGTSIHDLSADYVCKSRIAVLFKRYRWLGTFLDRMRDTFDKVIFIQRQYRMVSGLLHQRMQVLRHSILPQQTLQVTSHILAANDAVSSSIGMKIVEMSDVKKDFIAETFIVLAKLDFRKQFLEWFIRTKIDEAEYPQDYEDKREELVESIAKTNLQIEKLLDFIYHGDKNSDNAKHSKNFSQQGKLITRAKRARKKTQYSRFSKVVAEEVLHHNEAKHKQFEEEQQKEIIRQQLADQMAQHAQDENDQSSEATKKANKKSSGQVAEIMNKLNEELREKALNKLSNVQKMRKMLDRMLRPKFYLFSALNNSLLKLLLIRVAQIGERSGDDQGGEQLEFDEARIIEWYRREYFGNLCLWTPDHEDDNTHSIESTDRNRSNGTSGGNRSPRPKALNIVEPNENSEQQDPSPIAAETRIEME